MANALIITRVASILALFISSIALCVHLRWRLKTISRLRLHDYVLLLAGIFAEWMSFMLLIATTHGFGLPMSNQAYFSNETLQKILIVADVAYFICNMLVKHTWLIFYAGLAHQTWQKYSVWFMHFIAAGFGISLVAVTLLQCVPLSHIWQSEAPGICTVNMIGFSYANAAIMMTTDIVLYLMPMVFLSTVQMLRGHRLGVFFLFGLGGIIVIMSIGRLIAVHDLATSGTTSDRWARIMVWSTFENHLGVAVACAPSIKQALNFTWSRTAIDSIKRRFSRTDTSTMIELGDVETTTRSEAGVIYQDEKQMRSVSTASAC